MSEYARRVRAARGYAGITQEVLAERLGVDVQTIKRREAGTQDPKKGERIAIAAICDVPTSFMEEGFGEPSPSELLGRLDELRAMVSRLRAEGALPAPPDALLRPGEDEPTTGEDEGRGDFLGEPDAP